MKTALEDVRVLDLSRVLAGPYATQMLGDLGADVIKVERPGKGDDTRSWGPPWTTNADGSRGDASYFFACNRNKRSLALEPMNPQERRIIHAALQEVEGVSTHSVGTEPNRKVIVVPDGVKESRPREGGRRRGNNNR